MDIILKLSRFLYTLSLIAHGYRHFIYANFVAVTVPAWFPWYLLRTYLIGIVIIAAGLIKMMHPVFIIPG
jgi:uncharacterized membrane protein